jgi:uncharacterized protein (DUF3084 family)
VSSPTYTSVELQSAQRAAKRAKAIQQLDEEIANIETTIASRTARLQSLQNRRALLEQRLDDNITAITDLKKAKEVPL